MQVSNPRAAAFAILTTDHGAMIVNVNDRCMAEKGEIGVGSQLLRSSRFDGSQVMALNGLAALRRHYFGDGVIAIDCGANIGVFTLELARHMTGWGRVIAIEAQELIYYALSGNIVINNCLNARSILAAVGDRDGTMRIPVLDYTSSASFGSLELKPSVSEPIGQKVDYSEEAMVDVRLMKLDTLKLPRVDLVKIDVEGMELEVLHGAAQTITDLKPACYVELLKSDGARIQEFFSRRGYRAYPAGPDCLYIHEGDPCAKHIEATER